MRRPAQRSSVADATPGLDAANLNAGTRAADGWRALRRGTVGLGRDAGVRRTGRVRLVTGVSTMGYSGTMEVWDGRALAGGHPGRQPFPANQVNAYNAFTAAISE